jgi:bacillolysin
MFKRILGAVVAALLAAPIAATAGSTDLNKDKALAAVLRASGRQLVTHTQAETGEFGFVRATGTAVLSADDATADPAVRAFGFLQTYGALVGMSAAERHALHLDRTRDGYRTGTSSPLQILRVEADEAGKTHVRTTQSYRGLPVFGAQIIVTMSREGITAVDGDFVPGISVSATPRIAASDATSTALLTLRKVFPGVSLKVVSANLAIYRSGLVEGQPGVSSLAWGIEVAGRGIDERVFVDAVLNVTLRRIPLIDEAMYRVVYTPQYDHSNPDMFAVRKEGDPESPAPMVNNLYRFTGQVYNFFKSTFGRDSFDNKGAKMRTVYLVNNACPNAYWNGATTNYCPGFDDDDVVSHEWGHAYTEYTHDLVYVCQSGALNESYSDIWGETIDLLNGEDGVGGSNNAKPYPDGQRWLIGEDLGQSFQEQVQDQGPPADTTILRDMWNPMRAGDPGKVTDSPYVCDMATDGGGVHTNSGVSNHTYAMLVDGQTYNHQTIRGLGFTKAVHIYYQAMTSYQTPVTKFSDHAQALEASCDDLIGTPLRTPFTGALSAAITTDDCKQVAKAVKAAEMDKQPPQCKFTPILDHRAPALCPGATVVWTDDFSKGLANWTVHSQGAHAEWPGVDWRARSNAPGGHGGSVAYAEDPRGGSCESGNDYSGELWMDSKPVTVPDGITNLSMRFDHYIAAERTIDGGNVKVSVNGGSFAEIPQASYTLNAPNLALADNTPPQAAGGSTNPMGNQMAWTGTDGGTAIGSWGTTIAQLGSLAKPGDSIVLRFDFGVDCGGGIDGWYVDNVTLYSCPVLPGPDAVIKQASDAPVVGPYTISWSRPADATGPDTVQESTLSCAPLLADDAEGGLGNWDLTHDGTGSFDWETSTNKPQHTGAAFWGRELEGAMNASSTMTWKRPLTIRGPTTLEFSDWFVNEGDDLSLVEVSSNGGKTWEPVYSASRSDYVPLQLADFATESLTPRSVDLGKYAGKAIGLRFRFLAGPDDRAGSTPFGWFVDDIKIVTDSWHDVGTTPKTSLTIPGRATGGTYCYRVRTTYRVGGRAAPSAYGAAATLKVKGGAVPDVKGRRVDRGRLPSTGVGETWITAALLIVLAVLGARVARRREA